MLRAKKKRSAKGGLRGPVSASTCPRGSSFDRKSSCWDYYTFRLGIQRSLGSMERWHTLCLVLYITHHAQDTTLSQSCVCLGSQSASEVWARNPICGLRMEWDHSWVNLKQDGWNYMIWKETALFPQSFNTSFKRRAISEGRGLESQGETSEKSSVDLFCFKIEGDGFNLNH